MLCNLIFCPGSWLIVLACQFYLGCAESTELPRFTHDLCSSITPNWSLINFFVVKCEAPFVLWLLSIVHGYLTRFAQFRLLADLFTRNGLCPQMDGPFFPRLRATEALFNPMVPQSSREDFPFRYLFCGALPLSRVTAVEEPGS